MYELIKVFANIELFSGENMRQTPFSKGYRPVFDFKGAQTKISGRIDLLNMEMFAPGMSGVVEITFIKGMISDTYFVIGENFTFGEGPHPLGKGQIIETIDSKSSAPVL